MLHKMQFWKDLGFNGAKKVGDLASEEYRSVSSLQRQTQDPTVLCADVEDISRNDEGCHPFWYFWRDLNPSACVSLQLIGTRLVNAVEGCAING